MTETPDADAFTPEEAVDAIDRATGYEAPLRRRAEGVTWMVWGIVTVGIQLTFSSASTIFFRPAAERAALTPGWFEPAVVVTWALVGVATTAAVWRVASLRLPSLGGRDLRSAAGAALWLPLVYLGIGTLYVVAAGLPVAFYPLLGIGAAWTLLGAFDLLDATPVGRRVLVAVGILIVTAGVAASVTIARPGPEAVRYADTAPVTVFVGGGAPFLAGLWQTLRG